MQWASRTGRLFVVLRRPPLLSNMASCNLDESLLPTTEYKLPVMQYVPQILLECFYHRGSREKELALRSWWRRRKNVNTSVALSSVSIFEEKYPALLERDTTTRNIQFHVTLNKTSPVAEIKIHHLLWGCSRKTAAARYFFLRSEDVIVNKAAHGFCASSLGYPSATRPLFKIVLGCCFQNHGQPFSNVSRG